MYSRKKFIRVDNEQTLTIPDYLGNYHFNTLGNFIENPKAGLLFIDFAHGHVLTLTGTVEILWDSQESAFFAGAERLWRFTIDHGYSIGNAIPLRWSLQQYSPNTRLTGSWQEAEQRRLAEQERQRWMSYRIEKIVRESKQVKSFYLSPENGHRAQFKAGQFLTLKADIDGSEQIRSYTVSSAPADNFMRISVKQQQPGDTTKPDGLFSSYLHHDIKAGDLIWAKAPAGVFTLDVAVQRPALLLSAGIGITPMIAMARHNLLEGIRTRAMRPLMLICVFRNQLQQVFYEELNAICQQSNGYINCVWVFTQAEPTLTQGLDYHHSGRLNKTMLQALMPDDDCDFYLCGPGAFMQHSYDLLQQLGIADQRISAEAFGPASLNRQSGQASRQSIEMPVAEEAVISFRASGFEQLWTQNDGSLLEFAEHHGLSPQYGCRNGQCGACKVPLLSGQVSYTQAYTAAVEESDVLICCAAPAQQSQNPAKLTIDL